MPTNPRLPYSRAKKSLFNASDRQEILRRLAGLVQRLARQESEAAGRQTHSFFGWPTGDEWGVMMYKHLDDHLRQFGA
ncbi:MAG: hypothetical protein ACM3JH_09770 [Acidithiobacillales bacterium]